MHPGSFRIAQSLKPLKLAYGKPFRRRLQRKPPWSDQTVCAKMRFALPAAGWTIQAGITLGVATLLS